MIAVGAICWYWNNQNQQQCLETWEEACLDASSDWHVYNNEKYNFELKFPLSWDNYVVSEGDYSNYSYVGFSFRGDNRQPFTIFQIIKYTKEQWESINKELPLKILDQSDDYVLFCDGCCYDDGDFYGGGQFDNFQIERCKEVPEILKTFKSL